MKFKAFQPGSFLYRLVVSVLVGAMRLWAKSLRVKYIDPSGVSKSDGQPYIVLFWHNRIFAAPALMPQRLRAKTHALTSRSKDGQVIADALACLSIRAIRGSSAKRGKDKGGGSALRQMIEVVQRGEIVALIPDGPRGPMYTVQPGALAAASRTAVPIIAVSLNAKRYFSLKTWDRLQIPWPFSKAELVYSEPLIVESDLDDQQWQEGLERIHQTMMGVTQDQWKNSCKKF